MIHRSMRSFRWSMPVLLACSALASVCAQDDADPVDALVRKGSELCLAHDWTAAIEALNRAVELAPEDAEARKWRGHALTGAGEYAKAREDLERALALGADDAWTHYAHGMVFYHLGKPEDAIAEYGAALERDPSFYKAYEWRAFNRSVVGDQAGALLDVNTALSADEHNPGLYFIRAKIFQRLLDLENAEADLWRIVSTDASNADAYAQMGYVKACRGATDSAIGMLQQAVKIDPGAQVEARAWLFELLANAGRRDEAQAELAAIEGAAREKSDDDTLAWTAKIASFLGGALPASELVAAARASSVEPEARRCAAFLHIGLAQRRAGDRDAALVALARAVATGARDQWEWSLAVQVLREFE